MQDAWLKRLTLLVAERPIVILRLRSDQWTQLRGSRRELREFTVTYPHGILDRVKAPTVCLFEGGDDTDEGESLRIGVLRSKTAVSTLDSRVKVIRGTTLATRSLAELIEILSDRTHARNLTRRIEGDAPVVVLSPKLSEHVIDRLAAFVPDRDALRGVADSLQESKHFKGTAALQEDAVNSALKAFRIHVRDDAVEVDIARDKDTALRRVWIAEDTVIQHESRSMPGFDLVASDVTGRAVFEREDVRLEIITANKLPLEEAFGVDLIILNLTLSNVVMVQYKMLEPEREDRTHQDWIYRPDSQLEDQIVRMRTFDADLAPHSDDYRLNPGVFYFKFVKRDGNTRWGGIIVPLHHFELLRRDPACRGRRGGFRISHRGLSGRYLREEPFLDLIQSGYIGARAETAAQLKPLIERILAGDRALVAAIKSSRSERGQTTSSEALEKDDETQDYDLDA